MKLFCLTTTLFCILISGANLELAQAGHLPLDTNVHFAVSPDGGTTWVDIVPPDPAITGTYVIAERPSTNPVQIGGGNTITVEKLNAAEQIRVEWNDLTESFWLKNAKITSANPITDLRFRIWRNFTTSPNEAGNMKYDARGGGWLKRANGASAVGAKIIIRGFIETPAGTGTNNSINQLTGPPKSCVPRPDLLVKCATQQSSTISWSDFVIDSAPHVLVNPDHMVTMEFWLTLPHGGGALNKDYLQLASGGTGGIRVIGAAAQGAGDTSECDLCQGTDCATCPDCGDGTCPDGSQCVSCIKESEYGLGGKWACWLFGNCPACIIPDIRAERPIRAIRIP